MERSHNPGPGGAAGPGGPMRPEDFQRLVFESVKDFSIFTTDLRGVITSWSRGAENVFGYAEAEAIGRPAAIIFTPEDRAADVPGRELEQAARTGRAGDERWHLRKDGALFYASGTVTPLFEADGALVGFTKVARDITAARLASERLARSEARYRQLFDVMDEGFCVFEILRDAAGRPVDYRFEEVNRAFEELTGLADAAGRRMKELASDHEEFWFETYGAVAETGEPTRFEHAAEALGGRSFEVSAFRVGEPAEQRVAVLFNNVTDRKRIEAEREVLVAQLREADRRKDEFLAMLAHELRNPLGAIASGVELARASADPEVLDQVREMIGRQARHLTRLIDDLLDVSRIATGKIVLKPRTIELGRTIDRAVDQVRPLVEAKGHRLEISRPDRPVVLVADETRAEQILANLLANAAKYTPARGRVAIEAAVDAGDVVVRVVDDGVGIPAEMLPKVFGLFTQVDSSIDRSQGGLGIGLTLVRSLVEMHGGEVSAASGGEGRGSTFTVRLPIGEPDRSALEPRAVAPEHSGPAIRRVLIVDDNRDTARMTGRLLSLRGFEVRSAYDGPSGLDAARSCRPDVVLLDIGLPGMNGYEVAAALRRDPDTAAAIIVAVSGYGEDAARHRSRAAGFDHHLTKPLDFELLDQILRGDPGPAD